MKHIIYSLFLILLFSNCLAQNKSNKINWMTVEQVQEKMKTEPRKVYVDIYTDWCHWCKVMDKKTFTNKYVIEYMNANYYCIHFNAERKDAVTFNEKQYGLYPKSNTNSLAVEWTNGKLSYPTSIFFDENFINPQPVPGYMEINNMEMIAKYIAENKHKSIPFEKYKNSFKPTWK